MSALFHLNNLNIFQADSALAEWAAGRLADGEPPELQEEEAWTLEATLVAGLVGALARLGTRVEGALEPLETREVGLE